MEFGLVDKSNFLVDFFKNFLGRLYFKDFLKAIDFYESSCLPSYALHKERLFRNLKSFSIYDAALDRIFPASFKSALFGRADGVPFLDLSIEWDGKISVVRLNSVGNVGGYYSIPGAGFFIKADAVYQNAGRLLPALVDTAFNADCLDFAGRNNSKVQGMFNSAFEGDFLSQQNNFEVIQSFAIGNSNFVVDFSEMRGFNVAEGVTYDCFALAKALPTLGGIGVYPCRHLTSFNDAKYFAEKGANIELKSRLLAFEKSNGFNVDERRLHELLMRHVSVEVPFNSEDEFNAIKMRVNEIPKFGSFAVCLMPTAAFEGKVWLSFEIILNPDGASNAFHGVTAFREGYQSDFEKLVDFASSFVT